MSEPSSPLPPTAPISVPPMALPRTTPEQLAAAERAQAYWARRLPAWAAAPADSNA